jgi:hypothetical protein
MWHDFELILRLGESGRRGQQDKQDSQHHLAPSATDRKDEVIFLEEMNNRTTWIHLRMTSFSRSLPSFKSTIFIRLHQLQDHIVGHAMRIMFGKIYADYDGLQRMLHST